MSTQLTSNAKALRLFFTDDVFLVKNEMQTAFVELVKVKETLTQPEGVAIKEKVDDVVEKTTADLNLVEEPKIEIKPNFDFKYLGKNQKNILILVNDKQNEVSTEKGRELLRKLVLAINLTAKDFALVNYANYENADFKDLDGFFRCKILLSFGVGAKQLGLPGTLLQRQCL